MEKTTRTMYIELKKRCGVCHARQSAGYQIGSLFLCQECENDMIHTEPDEAFYQHCIDSVKGIWKP